MMLITNMTKYNVSVILVLGILLLICTWTINNEFKFTNTLQRNLYRFAEQKSIFKVRQEQNVELSLKSIRLECPKNQNKKLLPLAIKHLLKDVTESERLCEPKTQDGKGIKFLDNYKNPCWIEKLPFTPYSYPNKLLNLTLPLKKEIQSLKKNMDRMNKVFLFRQNNSRHSIRSKLGTRVRCLPYIYLAGIHKAGTSDLFHNIIKHPLVVTNAIKEPLFWKVIPSKFEFSDYLNFYDFQAEIISGYSDNHGFHPKVTIDALSNTATTTYHWTNGGNNKENGTVCTTPAEILSYLGVKSKFILLLREPIDWIQSCYNFFHFHLVSFLSPKIPSSASNIINNQILKQIRDMDECLQKKNNKFHCMFLGHADLCHIRNLLYYLWVENLEQMVGKGNLIVLNSSLYFKDRVPILNRIFKFLDLPPLSDKVILDIRKDREIKNKGKRSFFKLYPETKTMIEEFVRPWTRKLAEHLQDETFYWNNSYISSIL